MAALPAERVNESKDHGWARVLDLSPPKVSYDVKRTDSLVSPYTAVIRLERTYTVLFRPTEAEARAAQPEGRANLQLREYRFAYRDGRWVTSGGTEQMKTRATETGGFSDAGVGVIELSREDMLASKQLRGCLQP